jgi:predicted CXXCH cytochrome family protein
MKNSWTMSKIIQRLCHKGLIVAGAVMLVLFAPGMAAHAEDDDLSKETKACLKCHDKEGLEKKLENQETLSLYVSTKGFLDSMHKKTDCEDCHSDIDGKTHGKEKTPLKSMRELSLRMQGSCRECHKKNFAQYEDSLHAALVKEGSKESRKDAPVCSDCHRSHTLRSVKILQPIEATPCAKCHEDIFKAYSKDVHGLQRVAKGKASPICADCHKTHDVKAAAANEGIKDACLACHKDSVDIHKDWLPNAALHFEAISCPVCHAPGAQRRVNLRLYDNVAKRQIAEKTGVPLFEKRTDAADLKNVGLDERALLSLLKEYNQDKGQGNTILRGRLEVRSGVEAHQMSEKTKAIKDCDTCHKEGAEAFQSVTLTIASPDGRPLRHGVQKDVLTSLQATESVRGFYAIGSTRIKLLDYALILVFLAGVGGPLAHMTIKWLFRRFREKHDAEMRAELAQAHSQPLGDRRADDDASK